MAQVLTIAQIADALRQIGAQLSNSEKITNRLAKQVAQWKAHGVNSYTISQQANDILNTLSDGAGVGVVEEAIDLLQALTFEYREDVTVSEEEGFTGVNIYVLGDNLESFGKTGLAHPTVIFPVQEVTPDSTQTEAFERYESTGIFNNPFGAFKEGDVVRLSGSKTAANDGAYVVAKDANPDLEELLKDPNFQEDAGHWTKGGGGTDWSIGSGVADASAATDGAYIEAQESDWRKLPTTGLNYLVRAVVTGRSTGACSLRIDNLDGTYHTMNLTADGTYFIEFPAGTAAGTFLVRATKASGFDGSLSLLTITGLPLVLRNTLTGDTADTSMRVQLLKR